MYKYIQKNVARLMTLPADRRFICQNRHFQPSRSFKDLFFEKTLKNAVYLSIFTGKNGYVQHQTNKMKRYLLPVCFILLAGSVSAQDTFSIVAVDPVTGEVGSAGASCISKANLQTFFPFSDPNFLGDLLPGLGAINTQASYLAQNQQNARARLLAGDTPQQVIDWLQANDVQNNPGIRQYGVAALINGAPQAAGYTGANCINYKNHRVGPNYSIQGNILLGQQILDSMEARFLNTSGCLAEKLMAAMQGAKVPGADTRCLSNGTSSMFSFIKVAKPNDPANHPFLRLFVALNPVGIEPIDSLQTLFDAEAPCITATGDPASDELQVRLQPNPTPEAVTLWLPAPVAAAAVEAFDGTGRLLWRRESVPSGEALRFERPGAYLLHVRVSDGRRAVRRVIVY